MAIFLNTKESLKKFHGVCSIVPYTKYRPTSREYILNASAVWTKTALITGGVGGEGQGEILLNI